MNGPKTGRGLVFVALSRRMQQMIKSPNAGSARCLVRSGLAAAAMLALSAAPGQRAEAMSLINPGAAPAAKATSEGLITEIRHGGGGGGGGHHGGGGGFRGGGGFHGGGGGFHGGGGFRGGGAAFHSGGFRGGGPAFHSGGFRGGGAVFRGGGFRASPVFHGSGVRFAHRHHFHRHHFRPRFVYGASYYPYYDYAYYRPYRRCRIILTHYGPRRICHFRHWRHHYWRHHHRHYRYW